MTAIDDHAIHAETFKKHGRGLDVCLASVLNDLCKLPTNKFRESKKQRLTVDRNVLELSTVHNRDVPETVWIRAFEKKQTGVEVPQNDDEGQLVYGLGDNGDRRIKKSSTDAQVQMYKSWHKHHILCLQHWSSSLAPEQYAANGELKE